MRLYIHMFVCLFLLFYFFDSFSSLYLFVLSYSVCVCSVLFYCCFFDACLFSKKKTERVWIWIKREIEKISGDLGKGKP